MFKQKNHRFCFFFRIGRSFFVFFFFFGFLKKKGGSGLILGSVGLRQYNNFFFRPYTLKLTFKIVYAYHTYITRNIKKPKWWIFCKNLV